VSNTATPVIAPEAGSTNVIFETPPSMSAMLLKRLEYVAQQIAFSPATTICLETVTVYVLEMSTREAPYAGSVITALLSVPRKLSEKSTRRVVGLDTTGVVET
jgi:hypothetical protein